MDRNILYSSRVAMMRDLRMRVPIIRWVEMGIWLACTIRHGAAVYGGDAADAWFARFEDWSLL